MDGLRGNSKCSLTLGEPSAFPDDIKAACVELTNLSTDATWRGQGMADLLMAQVCKEADEAGKSLILTCKPIDLQTDSKRLQSFYAKHGFLVFQTKPLVLMCRPKARVK